MSIKSYTFDSTTFQTVILPKGTLLFRGLRFEDKMNYKSLFHDLIGYPREQYYTISPNMNVFFYPVPYASDAVSTYDIHVIYATQYDIELYLLIKPSNASRASTRTRKNIRQFITTCSTISDRDICGLEMSREDPCLTNTIMEHFPQIDGYITIAEQDASMFFKKYKKLVNQGFASYLIPSILRDSRNKLGIPEIVIHPLRIRPAECHIIGERFYNSEKIVSYCVKFRAQYNYFPLLYITSNRVYSFTDLMNMNVFDEMEQACRIFNVEDPPPLYHLMKDVLGQLFTTGYTVHDHIYRAVVDTRTGFYLIRTTVSSRGTMRRKKETRKFHDQTMTHIINYPDSEAIEPIIKSHHNYLDAFVNDLYVNGYAPRMKYIFNRGNKNEFAIQYHINRVIDRPELVKYTKQRARRNKRAMKRTMKQLKQIYNFEYDEAEDEL